MVKDEFGTAKALNVKVHIIKLNILNPVYIICILLGQFLLSEEVILPTLKWIKLKENIVKVSNFPKKNKRLKELDWGSGPTSSMIIYFQGTF